MVYSLLKHHGPFNLVLFLLPISYLSNYYCIYHSTIWSVCLSLSRTLGTWLCVILRRPEAKFKFLFVLQNCSLLRVCTVLIRVYAVLLRVGSVHNYKSHQVQLNHFNQVKIIISWDTVFWQPMFEKASD